MKLTHLFLILLISILCSCSSSRGMYNTNKSVRKAAPSGKYRHPTMFSRVNPFQGRAKAKLQKTQKRQRKLLRKKRARQGMLRKARKPGKTFGTKRTLSRRRMKSSGSRSKSSGGRGRGNKNLFNTRKK